MIFTTINNDLTSTIQGVSTLGDKVGILGVSFNDLISTLSSKNFNSKLFSKKELLGNLFAKTDTTIITNMDKVMLENYNKLLDQGVESGVAFQQAMYGASNGAKELAQSANKGKVNLDGVKVAADGATTSMIGAKIATIAFQTALTFGISFGISKLIELLNYINTIIPTVKNTMDALRDSAKDFEETQSEIEDLNSKLTETKERIQTLLDQPSLSLIEQNELNKLTAAKSDYEALIKLQETYLATTQDKKESDFVKAFEAKVVHNIPSNMDEWWEYLPFVKDWKQGIFGLLTMSDEDIEQDFDDDSLQYAIKRLDEWGNARAKAIAEGNKKAEEEAQLGIKSELTMMSTYSKSLQDMLKEFGDYDYDKLSEDGKRAINYIKDVEYAILHYKTKYDENVDNTQILFDDILNDKRFAEGKKAIDQLKQSGDLAAGVLKNLYDSGNNENFNALIDHMITFGLMSDTTAGSFEGLAIQIADSDSALQEMANNNAAEKLSKEFEELNNQLSEAMSAFDTVKSAIKEYAENGALSAETLSKLLALEPEYLNLLVDENGQLNLNSEGYETLIKSKLRNMLLNKMQASFDYILSLTKEEAAAFAAGKAYDAETSSIYELLGAKMKLAMADAMKKDSEENTNVYTQAILREAQAYAPLVSAVEDYDIAAESASKTNESSTKTTNAQKEALEEQKKALEDSKKALEEYKNEVTDAQSAIKKLIDAVTDYIKQQKEDEKTILEDRKKAFDELIDKEKEELAAKKESAKFDEELAKKQNTVAKDALAASIASLDDSSAGRKAQKQANDALAESRSDLISTLSDHEYDIRVAALDKLKEKNDEYYDAEIKKIDDYLANTRKLYNDACSMIENDTGDLYGKLWTYTYQHTTQTKAEFDYMWNSAQSALERYGVAQYGVIGVMEFLQGAIYNTESKIKELDGEIDNLSTVISNVSESINNMADSSLSNVATKIGDIKREYQDLLASLKEQMAPKWYVDINGRRYSSSFENQSDAINDILRQYTASVDFNHLNPTLVNNKSVKHYAAGTSSAAGGLSLVGERGAELRVLNSGDGIVKNQVVRGITALGTNPAQFLAEAGQRLVSSLFKNNMKPAFEAITGSGSVAPEINIVIQGDATQSTVNALKEQTEKIANYTLRMIQSDTLRRTRSSRVR